jgi:hypothetical protein
MAVAKNDRWDEECHLSIESFLPKALRFPLLTTNMFLPIPLKPKGMHWLTYQRLVAGTASASQTEVLSKNPTPQQESFRGSGQSRPHFLPGRSRAPETAWAQVDTQYSALIDHLTPSGIPNSPTVLDLRCDFTLDRGFIGTIPQKGFIDVPEKGMK